ncbi:GGDEF domain-containing protein [Colwellia sp. BRX10-3]|uniref:GGDEF domain-containing protein n=1 Tax=Colwellia sp. BRX10-3 TaxID=2759844 RepID=UPI0015F76B27|nr:GGDEF domain-containing protein [Colwellia sp. BRX10-3]MBA6391006.1 GGDEF domain-containing protein [Colwellia sp. BRX10-3]
MKLSLQQSIYSFTLSSCLFFIVLVISILWSIQVVNVALERERYANKVENHANILQQFISIENIYASDFNTDSWLALDRKFNELLELTPSLTPQQQTIQNSIVSQNKNVLRLFNAINKNKLINADEKIKTHLKVRLITQLEAIKADSIQLFNTVQVDINNVIRQQLILVLSILSLTLFILVYGAFKLVKIFRTSLKEVKFAFAKNRSGNFQKIQLSNKSEEFESIANAFNDMNTELSETTVSLESMTKIVEERTKVLEQLSNTDPLTNVGNRRSLFERGNAEFARVQRTKSQFTIILLDCDFFKDVNDQFGHSCGDEVLKCICKICSEEIRNIDFFARYGGEEFIILLPDSELSGAVKTAERIQDSLANNCLLFEGKDIRVTISIGICMVNNKHTSFEDVIKDADLAMYRAKENGRNRIEVMDDDSPDEEATDDTSLDTAISDNNISY